MVVGFLTNCIGVNMKNKKYFSQKNILVFLGVSLFYLVFSLVNYFFSKRNGQLGLGGIISFGGGNDSFFYWQQAMNYYHDPKTILTETSIYVPLIANVIKFVKILDPIVLKLLNYFVFLISIYLIIKVNQTVSDNNMKIRNRLILTYLLVYPSLIFIITTGIFRDVWILAFQLLACLNYLKFFRTKKVFFLIMGLANTYLLSQFRGYAGLAMIVALIVIAMIELVSYKRIKQIIVIVILIFVFWYSFFRNLQLPIVNMSLSDALDYRTSTIDLYSGGSTIGIRLDQPNIVLFIVNYFYSFLSNLVGPLINQWNSVATLMTGIIESFPILYMIIKIIKNKSKISRDSFYLLIINTIWIATIAISNDNLGTATRLRLFTYISLVIVFLQTININEDRK